MWGQMSGPNVVDEVSADRIRAHIEKIVREIPHRAAGSANGKRMAEYSRDAMKAVGLDDTVDPRAARDRLISRARRISRRGAVGDRDPGQHARP